MILTHLSGTEHLLIFSTSIVIYAISDRSVELNTEFRVHRRKYFNIIPQAVDTQSELVEAAADRIQSYLVRQRLAEQPSAMVAYRKGGMVTAEITAILAEECCQELLAPVNVAYEDEKAQILGENSWLSAETVSKRRESEVAATVYATGFLLRNIQLEMV